MKQPDLILFAKQPVPGGVKTRLQPQCSPEQAAEIASFLIRATAELAVSFWPGDVYLYAWPDQDHELFQELAATFRVRLAKQADGDLGHKMYRALADGVARRGAAAVMGCDVPHCGWEIIEQAHEHLAKGRDVIGTTVDGGYYLLGLQRPVEKLFAGIHWGSHSVAPETMVRARAMGISLEHLPTLRDIDTWQDLRAVAAGFDPLRLFVEKIPPPVVAD